MVLSQTLSRDTVPFKYFLKNVSTFLIGFPAKLVSFRISRNRKRNKFRVSQNKLVVSRNFALKRNKQFHMFRYFLNETKQPVSQVLYNFFQMLSYIKKIVFYMNKNVPLSHEGWAFGPFNPDPYIFCLDPHLFLLAHYVGCRIGAPNFSLFK
jgi:hypothetical protein